MTHDFVDILLSELARRCQNNPRYSMRSFAKALGISPANLSLILSRKRIASPKTLEKAVSRLDLKNEALSTLLRKRMSLPVVLPERDSMDLETFGKISNWVSYAILSLILTKDFRPEEAWIAARLGVSKHEVRNSISGLKAAKMISTVSGRWKVTGKPIRMNNIGSTSITRGFDKQILAKAQESLENDPVEIRNLSSITFAMSPDRLKAAQEEIRKFRLRMSELFEESEISTEVYNLSVQLIPFTRSKL